MARGWDSKSVEDQVQEFQSKDGEQQQKKKNHPSPDEADLVRRQKVQALSLARVRSQLEACSDPRYREQLERALADLERLTAEDLAK